VAAASRALTITTDRQGEPAVSQDPSTGDTPADYGGTPPGGGGSPTATSAAGVGARIGARILDALIVGIPLGIILALIGLGFGTIGSGVVSALIYFGYFVLLETNQGATLGKKILGMRVVGADGGNPPPDVAAKRNLWMLLGIIPVVGGLLSLIAVIAIIVTIVQSPEQRGWHDQFAGSSVLR
jgi:uncharacterized RDD family membrane protein YckC